MSKLDELSDDILAQICLFIDYKEIYQKFTILSFNWGRLLTSYIRQKYNILIDQKPYFYCSSLITCSTNRTRSTYSKIHLLSKFYNLSFIKLLDCGYNYIASLPSFPPNLISLYASGNKFYWLNALPTSLKYLDCSSNYLSNLPLLISTNLTFLKCSHNKIVELPELPNSLTTLICSYNELKELPSLNNIISLNCSNNHLISLPKLPSSLLQLICTFNKLVTLPDLPDGITTLICDKNPINILPNLPHSILHLNSTNTNLDPLHQIIFQNSIEALNLF